MLFPNQLQIQLVGMDSGVDASSSHHRKMRSRKAVTSVQAPTWPRAQQGDWAERHSSTLCCSIGRMDPLHILLGFLKS